MNQLLIFTLDADLAGDLGVYATVISIGRLLVHMASLVFAMFFLRRHHRESARSVRQLAAFSISTAKCSVEEDRAVVHGKITSMMQAACTAEDGDDVLRSFDMYVRTHLPSAMERGYRFPMRYSLTVFIANFGRAFDTIGSDMAAGTTLRFCSSSLLLLAVVGHSMWHHAVFLHVGALLPMSPSPRVFRVRVRGAGNVRAGSLHEMLDRASDLLRDGAATRDSVAAWYFAFSVLLISVNLFLYRVEGNWSVRSWVERRRTLKLQPFSVSASDIHQQSDEIEVMAECTCRGRRST